MNFYLINPDAEHRGIFLIKICESEASETQYWLEVIVEAKWLSWEKVKTEY
jgi:hypothetical protein